MRANPFKKVNKEILNEVLIETSPSTIPYEELDYILKDFDPAKVLAVRSLYRPNLVRVYGINIELHTQFLREITDLLEREHTIRRDVVRTARSVYDDYVFYVSEDGFIINRSSGYVGLKEALLDFIQVYRKMEIADKPSQLTRHNLTLCSVVMEDCLEFMKEVQYAIEQSIRLQEHPDR